MRHQLRLKTKLRREACYFKVVRRPNIKHWARHGAPCPDVGQDLSQLETTDDIEDVPRGMLKLQKMSAVGSSEKVGLSDPFWTRVWRSADDKATALGCFRARKTE